MSGHVTESRWLACRVPKLDRGLSWPARNDGSSLHDPHTSSNASAGANCYVGDQSKLRERP